MPDTLLIGLILLLAVAVVFGYFYQKRAQGRDVVKTTEVVRPAAGTVQPAAPTPTTTATDDVVRRDGINED